MISLDRKTGNEALMTRVRQMVKRRNHGIITVFIAAALHKSLLLYPGTHPNDFCDLLR